MLIQAVWAKHYIVVIGKTSLEGILQFFGWFWAEGGSGVKLSRPFPEE